VNTYDPEKIKESEIVWIVTEAELPSMRPKMDPRHARGLLSSATIDYGFTSAFALGVLDSDAVIYEKHRPEDNTRFQVYASGCSVCLDKEGTTIGLGVHLETMLHNRQEAAKYLGLKLNLKPKHATEAQA
jgi:hypothetical protein